MFRSGNILLYCLVLQTVTVIFGKGMIEVFKWKQMDFYNRGDGNSVSHKPPHRQRQPPGGPVIFPGRYSRSANANVGTPISVPDNNTIYIPYNNVPIGVTHYRDRIFVTVPRRSPGIPSTLNYIDVTRDGSQTSPKLHAFPDFERNQFNSSSHNLVSVYRTTVDTCDRLWFIDTGMLEYPNNRQQIRRPSIWIVDLKSDRVLQRHEIPESIVEIGRGLASVTIDVSSKSCGTAFAYIPDLVNMQLHVYSLGEDKIWSFSHNYFNYDPLAGDLNVGGQTFRWNDGIFSTTLGPKHADGSRDVFFHPMASDNEFVVNNRVLQHEANAARSDHGNDFRLLGSRGVNKESTIHEYDPQTGVIFYNEVQTNGVGCWNTKKPFSSANHGVVHSDDERMIYPSDLTIDEEGTIWVMTNSMPIFVYSTLNANEYNFRIWKQHVRDAKRGTVCE